MKKNNYINYIDVNYLDLLEIQSDEKLKTMNEKNNLIFKMDRYFKKVVDLKNKINEISEKTEKDKEIIEELERRKFQMLKIRDRIII